MGLDLGLNFGQSSSDTKTNQTSTTNATQTEQQQRQQVQAQASQQTAQQQQQQQQTGKQTTTAQTSNLSQDVVDMLTSVSKGLTANIDLNPLLASATKSNIDLSSLMASRAGGIEDKVTALNDLVSSAARSQFATNTMGDINLIAQGIGSKDNSYYLGTLANARAQLEGNIAGLQSQNTLQGLNLETGALSGAASAGDAATQLAASLQGGNPTAVANLSNIVQLLKGAQTTQTADTSTLQALTSQTQSAQQAQSLAAMLDFLTGIKNLTSTTNTQGTSSTDKTSFGESLSGSDL